MEANSRTQGDQTCTQRKCEWILPSFKQNVEYLPVKDIDFTSAKGKKRKLDDAINTVSDAIVPITPQQYNKVIPIREDYDTFYEHLSRTGTKPAILSLIPEYSDTYVPKRMLPTFPQPLPLLYISLSTINWTITNY